MFLTLHLTGGIRLLMIEFGPWRGLRKGSIQLGIILAIAYGLIFLYLGSE
jgi:fumarate reductase subunit D